MPPEQLLVFKVGEGWDRLCKFLDKPIPSDDKSFPRENVGGQAGNIVDKMQEFKTASKIKGEINRSFLLAGLIAGSIGVGVLAYVKPNIIQFLKG